MNSFTFHETFSLVTIAIIGVTHFFAAACSYYLEKRLGQRPMFAVTLLLIGWCHLSLGSAISGLGRIWSPVLVFAPMLSGYIGPALFIYTRQLTAPHRPTSAKWLLLGLFGTTFSVLSLTLPQGLDHAIAAVIDHKPYWHTIFSPIMVVHSTQLVSFILLSTYLSTHALIRGSRPDLRRTLFWLVITCWTCLAVACLTNVLPMFKIMLTGIEPFIVTLPISVVGCLGIKAMGEETLGRREDRDSALQIRMESLGRMARGLSHELNNVLTEMVGHAEVARLRLKPESEAGPHLQKIIEGSQRASALLKQMLTYSNRKDRVRKVIDSKDALTAAFEAMEALSHEGIKMRLEMESDLPAIQIDGAELKVAIMNLLRNGIDALDKNPGRISLRATSEAKVRLPPGTLGMDLNDAHALRIEVEDSGPGMSNAIIARAFEPFYSTKATGKGLGLANVLSTIKGANGALWFQSDGGVGTRFVLWLPAANGDPAESSTAASQTASPFRSALLVEDESPVAFVLTQLLNCLQLQVHRCATAEEAIALLKSEHSPDFDLAVVDIRLGAMDGIELSQRLLHHHHFKNILLISGDEPGERLQQFKDDAVIFRRKPLTLDQLRQAMTELGSPLPDSIPRPQAEQTQNQAHQNREHKQ